MQLITDSYRPIEIYIIIQKSKFGFIDMILLVLVELLSKNVLAIDYHNVGGKVSAVNIKTGANYNTYGAEPIDHIFLHIFNDNPSTVFSFQYALLVGIGKASSKYKMIRLASKSAKLREHLKYVTIFSMFGKVCLNREGNILSEQVSRELITVKEKLKILFRDSKSNQVEILNLIKHRYYFLDSFNVYDAFGENVLEILADYKSGSYDIQYELNLEYFKMRLQMAHIEILKMNNKLRQEEIDRNGDGLGDDSW